MGLSERTAELLLLDTLVTDAQSGNGRTVLIEGPPGAGKTELIEAARLMAADRGVAALVARGDELEREFAYGVVRQLFERRIAQRGGRSREALFAGAARLAASLFREEPDRGAPGGAAGDPFPIRHGLFWLTVGLSAESPLLLLVDDAHWSDEASLSWVHYLVRRLEGLPVSLALAARSTEPDAPVPLIETVRREPMVTAVRPAPLGAEGARAVLAAEFEAEPTPGFTRACLEATGGNPYLLTELARCLAAEGVRPEEGGRARVGGVSPESVRSRTLARLRRLGPEAEGVAATVAILGDGAAVRDVAHLTGLDPSTAAAAADSLTAAAVLAPGRPLRFEHPLVRAAVDTGLAEGDRASRHKEAARLFADRSASPERIAAHLMLCEPAGEPWVIDSLVEAGAGATSRGEHAVAARYLERALAEDMPAARRDLLLALGSAQAQAFDPAAAANLTEALRLSDTPDARVAAARALALSLVRLGRVPEAVDILAAELERTNPASDSYLELEADFAAALHFGVDFGVTEAATALEELLAHQPADLSAETPASRSLLASRAYSSALAGRPADGAEADARKALQGGLLFDQGPAAPAWAAAAHALAIVESPAAMEWLDQGVQQSTVTGSRYGLALNHNILSIRSIRVGAVTTAEAHGWEGLIGTRDLDIKLGLPAALGALIDALVERGKFDVAWEELARDGLENAVPDFSTGAILAESRGRLRMATRDIEGGLADFLEAGERFERREVAGPGMTSWRSLAAEANVLLGKRAEARELAERELDAARTFGRPRPIGIALRALGLSLDGEAAIERLKDAVEVLEPSAARLEHARALCDLGAAMRRRKQRRESREVLAKAADIAARCGATVLAERAAEELRASGARPRRLRLSGVDSLTPSELRVARLAAQGLSNREIAQALFVTQKTVEKHLGSSYTKLGIASREQLPKLLDQDRPA